MAEPARYYVEGVTLEIDLTPPWWGGGELLEICAEAYRMLTTSPLADDIASIDIGVHGIKVRVPLDEDWPAGAIKKWRDAALEAFDAMPEARQAIESHRELEAERKAEKEYRRKVRAELYGRPWRVQYGHSEGHAFHPERASVVYGCGHERALDPTQPATLDTEERCPTCAAA